MWRRVKRPGSDDRFVLIRPTTRKQEYLMRMERKKLLPAKA